MTVAFGDAFAQQEFNENGITYHMQDSIDDWFNNGNLLKQVMYAGPASLRYCFSHSFYPFNVDQVPLARTEKYY